MVTHMSSLQSIITQDNSKALRVLTLVFLKFFIYFNIKIYFVYFNIRVYFYLFYANTLQKLTLTLSPSFLTLNNLYGSNHQSENSVHPSLILPMVVTIAATSLHSRGDNSTNWVLGFSNLKSRSPPEPHRHSLLWQQ